MIPITIVKNVYEADYITHDGNFHADEIFATVILNKVSEKFKFKNFRLARVSKLPKKMLKHPIIYDIGGGKYDHHQVSGNGERKNGVPYASCGLIWRWYGNYLLDEVSNSNLVWSFIDKELIQGIDAIDNATFPKADYPARVMSISSVISSFNPNWDDEENIDAAFLKAVEFAEVIFDNVFNSAISKAKAKDIVEEAIENSKDGIMILEKNVPWKDFIYFSENPKAKDILFVVSSSKRNGYSWKGVPVFLGKYELRKNTPKKWWGLQEEELRKVSGIQTATFCHNRGFIGSAETMEDAIKMAKLAIEIED